MTSEAGRTIERVKLSSALRTNSLRRGRNEAAVPNAKSFQKVLRIGRKLAGSDLDDAHSLIRPWPNLDTDGSPFAFCTDGSRVKGEDSAGLLVAYDAHFLAHRSPSEESVDALADQSGLIGRVVGVIEHFDEVKVLPVLVQNEALLHT